MANREYTEYYRWKNIVYIMKNNCLNFIILVNVNSEILSYSNPRHVWPAPFEACTLGFSVASQGLLDKEDN